MVAVKSKLKIIAYRPEVQLTDMTSVYETCQKSQMGYVLTCHSLRMYFLFSLFFKGNFQNHRLIFRKCHFSKFCKTSNSLKFKMFCCFSATVMIQITCAYKNQFTFPLIINFFQKMQFYNFCPKILHWHPQY